MVMISILAHAEEAQETVTATENLLTSLGHQPFIVAILICVVILFAIYGLLGILKVSFIGKLLAMVPSAIALAIFFLPHQPTVTTTILSAGFIGTFLLTFTMMAGNKK